MIMRYPKGDDLADERAREKGVGLQFSFEFVVTTLDDLLRSLGGFLAFEVGV